MKTTMDPRQINEIRLAYGLSCRELADVLGDHVGTVHRWVAGHAKPDGQRKPVTIKGIAAAILPAMDAYAGEFASNWEDTPERRSASGVGHEVLCSLRAGRKLKALALLIKHVNTEGGK